MEPTIPSRAARVLATLVILFVLAMQAQAVIPLRRLWPLLGYPMYRTAHYAGEAVHRYHVFATTTGGAEVELGPDSLGLSFFKHLYGPVEALQQGDRARLATFVAIYEKRHGVTLREVRLEDRPIVIGDSKVTEEEPTTLARVTLEVGAADAGESATGEAR